MRAALAAACVALAACGPVTYPGTPEDPPRMLSESDAARPIELERGKRITLRLEANHSTAHRWSLVQSGDAELDQIGEPFYATERAVAGGGGAEYWTFRATRSGTKQLRFEYGRPWEKPAAKVLTYTVNVR
jgi:inhibitor of cysteine peptidase